MQTEKCAAARAKLSTLLSKVREIKKQISNLYDLHQEFTFSTLIQPKSRAPTVIMEENDENKENSLNALNKANFTNRSGVKQIKQMKHAMKSFSKTACIVQDSLSTLKNKNDEIKDLKAGLIQQLSEIKSMEKKSESMRRANQKIKEYSSHQKRNYRGTSLSREKQGNIQAGKSSIILQICDKTVESIVFDSKISLSPPIVEPVSKTLKCPKGHEFYEGYVNKQGQPHGNGRLDICCGAIPTELGCQKLKDSVFYQGQFKDGKFHGFGTLSYKGGVKYVGEFRQGRRHGKGSMYCNGKAEVANWQNDTFISIM